MKLTEPEKRLKERYTVAKVRSLYQNEVMIVAGNHICVIGLRSPRTADALRDNLARALAKIVEEER